MNENDPRWFARLDVKRPNDSTDYSDLLPLVASHLRLHVSAEQFLGPYNARQRASNFPYRAPDRETLRQLIKPGGVNEFTYAAFISGLLKFCEQYRGQRALPLPHPSTIHSVQLPLPAFELKDDGAGGTMIKIIGIEEPLVVRGLRTPGEVKFIIVRPKLSKLGTASATNWEVLFFKQPVGYLPEWVDSNLNPKYSGVL